jgi:tRNA (guanine37-N1)-methyltransferase
MWSAKIFTLYPEFFPGILDIGLYKKARENKIWSLDVINIRDYALDKHGSVDDTPFGGGSGMVMRADVIDNCLEKNIENSNNELIYLSPRGELLNQNIAKQLSQTNGVDLICGHFEGVDQRIIEERKIREISVGDFILSGGESAAFVFLDSIIRLLPGVIGNSASLNEESFENNLLEYPQYTKPQEWKGRTVPKVLLSGNHAKIKDWRLSQSEDITRRQRQDLWEKYHK